MQADSIIFTSLGNYQVDHFQKQYQHSEFIFCSFCALAHKKQTTVLVALLGFVLLMKLTLTTYETNISLVEKNKAQQISFQTEGAGSSAFC